MSNKKNRWLTLALSVCAYFSLALGVFLIPKANADTTSNPEKVTVLSPNNSENFSTLATTTNDGCLTELDGEMVYYTNATKAAALTYTKSVKNYTATIEFKTATETTATNTEFRIYLNGGKTDYVIRLTSSYLAVYEPGDRSSWNTSSQFIFKTNKNYRDGNWHTFTASLYGGKFFLTMDGTFLPNTNNMNNPDKYSASTNHLYTNMVKDSETEVLTETEIPEGQFGVYGHNYYVRNFSVDLYDTNATVGNAQFSTSHQIYADVDTASTAGYTDEQFSKILSYAQKAIEEVNLATTTESVSSAYATFTKNVQKSTFENYEYTFSSSKTPATDFTLSSGTLTTENGANQIVAGSSYS